MVTFDLAAKVVTSRQRAFVVHAGRQRRNHFVFLENDAAFLEVPDFGLSKDIVSSKPLLRQAVRRFFARQEYILDPTSNAEPSNSLADYSADSIEDGSKNALFGSMNTLFAKARVGDIVITPGFERLQKYRRPVVHFGEIVTKFEDGDVLEGGTEATYRVPFRRVKWLSTVERRLVPAGLEIQISKPPAVREIAIADYAEEILNLSYSNYIYGDGSASLIQAKGYNATEFQTLNSASELIGILVAGYAFAKERDHPQRISSLEDFTREYLSQSGIENIEINFSSPGWWRIIGGNPTMAMFVALGIAVLTSGLSVSALQGGIKVDNSVSATSEVENELEQSIDIFLKSLSPAQLEQVNKQASNARERIGLSSPVRRK